MFEIAVAAVTVTAIATLLHYEVLRILNATMPKLRMPHRARLLVVVFTVLASHALQIGLYGAMLWLLLAQGDVGTLAGVPQASFEACLYLSAETFTTLGFGDVTPVGPVRLLAGVESLNGLVLIGWSASYLYLAMEKFWTLER